MYLELKGGLGIIIFLAKKDVNVGVEEPLLTQDMMSSLDVVAVDSTFDSN